MNKTAVIIILDFSTAIAHTYDYDETVLEKYDDYFTYLNEKHGTSFREKDCQWMMVDEYVLKENHTAK